MNEGLLKRLKTIHERYVQLEGFVSDPAVMANTSLYSSYMKERGGLTKIVGRYFQLDELFRKKEEVQRILTEGDKELYTLAREELEGIEKREKELVEEITGLLLAQDSSNRRGVIMEIRAGTGGEEAALFAADLFRMYVKYAEKKGWKLDVFDSNPTELGGFKEIVFSVEGEGAYEKLHNESGTHRVQRVPVTETQGRIHTSAATVAVLPEVEEVEVDIDPKDLKIETMRSSGPGGQKVNKTSSAVRITHIPTGIVVRCQDEKSQHKNRAKAMRILRSRLHESLQAQEHEKRARARRVQIGTGDRSEKIRTYNFPQNRVTDHRVTLTLYNLEDVMLGQLDGLVEKLLAFEREEQLKQLALSP